MLKRLSLIIVVSIGFVFTANAQDPVFSQFYANQLYLNPAFAGSDKCPRASLNYRNQWPKMGNAFVTYSASYDQHIDLLEGGVGFHLMQDVVANGAINTTYANFMYSYAFQVNKRFFIRGGFQASYISKHRGGEEIFPDQLDPLYGNVFATSENLNDLNTNIGFFDFSLGALGYTGNHYFGFAIHHLTQPSESYKDNNDAVRPRKYTVHYGTKIPLRTNNLRKGELYLSPNIIFQQQGGFQNLSYGLYLYRKSIVGGLWVRQNFKAEFDSFTMMLGYIKDNLRVSYSYDLTVSRLRNSTLGAHEISFGYKFNCVRKKNRYSIISCPSI